MHHYGQRDHATVECELLNTTSYPVKRIAHETGLGTPLRLQRIFRKRFNTTPTVWRKTQASDSLGRQSA